MTDTMVKLFNSLHGVYLGQLIGGFILGGLLWWADANPVVIAIFCMGNYALAMLYRLAYLVLCIIVARPPPL